MGELSDDCKQRLRELDDLLGIYETRHDWQEGSIDAAIEEVRVRSGQADKDCIPALRGVEAQLFLIRGLVSERAPAQVLAAAFASTRNWLRDQMASA